MLPSASTTKRTLDFMLDFIVSNSLRQSIASMNLSYVIVRVGMLSTQLNKTSELFPISLLAGNSTLPAQ